VSPLINVTILGHVELVESNAKLQEKTLDLFAFVTSWGGEYSYLFRHGSWFSHSDPDLDLLAIP